MNRRLFLALIALLAALASRPSAGAEQPFITLASTTSTEQSGLFGFLLPRFILSRLIASRKLRITWGLAGPRARRRPPPPPAPS